MSWRYNARFPQHESSQSSTTTPFPGNKSGLASGSSSGQDNSAGSPSYSTQAPLYRFSQQSRNLSGDGFPYGVVHNFQNDSTSNSARIQHNMPQSSYLHGANYNQLGKLCPTFLSRATSHVTTGTVSLQTDPTNYVSALQNRQLQQSHPQDFSLAATYARLLLRGWDHSTFCNKDQQLGHFGHGQSNEISRQPDMRHTTSLYSPGPLPGTRSLNTTLCQPGSSQMGVDFSGNSHRQPEMTLGALAKEGQTNFNIVKSHCSSIDDADAFLKLSSIHVSPPHLQHHINESNRAERNQCWKTPFAEAKDKGITEGVAGTPEHVEGQNSMLCRNRISSTTVGSVQAYQVNYPNLRSLNGSIATKGTADGEIKCPASCTTSRQVEETSAAASLKPLFDVQLSDPSPESENHSRSLNRLLELIKDADWLLANPPECQATKHLPEDIQDLNTASSLSQETCPSEEVHHQVAYSHQQSPADSGLQPLVTAAPPVSTCVQQQGLSSFNTNATVALAGFPLPGSPSAGLGVRHPGGERQGVEREASVSSFLSAESGTSSGALLVDSHTGVSHVDASVNTPESVALPTERPVTLNDKASGVEEAFVRRDFSPESSNRLAQLNNLIRSNDGRPPYACKACGYACNILSRMKVHLRIHTGEKPYMCSYCGKNFRQLNIVKNHQRIHTGEKPRTCSHCGKTFRQLSTLQCHERIHMGEKPYICQFCPKAFRQKHHLLQHQRTHTGEKPYSCPFCSKFFRSSSSLACHKKTHPIV